MICERDRTIPGIPEGRKGIKTDGSLIPLRKNVNGDDLLLMVRHISPPWEPSGKYQKYFGSNESVLLINIFATDGKDIQNAGFIDWKITDGEALCANRQLYIKPENDFERVAVENYGYPFMAESFRVEPEFQRSGIGTFMGALSIATLAGIGAESFIPGRRVTEKGRLVWKKFGVEVPLVPDPILLQPLVSHPQLKASIAEFL